MLSFVKKVQALPDIHLNNKEVQYLRDIIEELPEKNGLQLLQALQVISQEPTSIDLSPSHIIELINYLSLWQRAEVALIEANHALAAQWCQTHHTPISNDELIPMTIDALPNDIDVLLSILHKIELICMISSMDILAFSLANLQTALMTKIYETFHTQLVNELHQLCDNYLNHLQCASSLPEAKIIAIVDMRMSLERKYKSSIDKLEEFTEKYYHHFKLLQPKDNLFTKLKHLLNTPTENDYLQRLSLFARKYENQRNKNILQFFQMLKPR